jgi:hypothetical protein
VLSLLLIQLLSVTSRNLKSFVIKSVHLSKAMLLTVVPGIAQSVQRRATGETARALFPSNARFVYPSQRLDRLWSPLRLLFHRHGGFSQGLKRQGREADHLPPYSAKVTNRLCSRLLFLHNFVHSKQSRDLI